MRSASFDPMLCLNSSVTASLDTGEAVGNRFNGLDEEPTYRYVPAPVAVRASAFSGRGRLKVPLTRCASCRGARIGHAEPRVARGGNHVRSRGGGVVLCQPGRERAERGRRAEAQRERRRGGVRRHRHGQRAQEPVRRVCPAATASDSPGFAPQGKARARTRAIASVQPRLGAVVVESETDSADTNAAEHNVRRVCEGFISGRLVGGRAGDARRGGAGGGAGAGRVVARADPGERGVEELRARDRDRGRGAGAHRVGLRGGDQRGGSGRSVEGPGDADLHGGRSGARGRARLRPRGRGSAVLHRERGHARGHRNVGDVAQRLQRDAPVPVLGGQHDADAARGGGRHQPQGRQRHQLHRRRHAADRRPTRRRSRRSARRRARPRCSPRRRPARRTSRSRRRPVWPPATRCASTARRSRSPTSAPRAATPRSRPRPPRARRTSGSRA